MKDDISGTHNDQSLSIEQLHEQIRAKYGLIHDKTECVWVQEMDQDLLILTNSNKDNIKNLSEELMRNNEFLCDALGEDYQNNQFAAAALKKVNSHLGCLPDSSPLISMTLTQMAIGQHLQKRKKEIDEQAYSFKATRAYLEEVLNN